MLEVFRRCIVDDWRRVGEDWRSLRREVRKPELGGSFCFALGFSSALRWGHRLFQYVDALLDWCEGTVEITGNSNHLIGS
jgi:hypothetical protein